MEGQDWVVTFIPNSKDYVAHDDGRDKGTPVDSMTTKGWKNALVGNSPREVDPNLNLICIQTEEDTTIELPNKIMDRILLNM
ncbi:hypothetical protein SUGI_1181440, partial [Cryptomeria japonica]